LRTLLLQRRRRERRRGILAALALLDVGDGEGALTGLRSRRDIARDAIDLVDDRPRVFAIVDLGLLAVDRVELGGELLPALLEIGLDRPVLLGREGADGALALDDEPERDGL